MARIAAAARTGLRGNLGHGRRTVNVDCLANRRFLDFVAVTDHSVGLSEQRVFRLKFHDTSDLENQSQQLQA